MKLIFAHSYIYRVHFFQKNIEVRYDYGGTALSIVVDISERPTTNSLNLASSLLSGPKRKRAWSNAARATYVRLRLLFSFHEVIGGQGLEHRQLAGLPSAANKVPRFLHEATSDGTSSRYTSTATLSGHVRRRHRNLLLR